VVHVTVEALRSTEDRVQKQDTISCETTDGVVRLVLSNPARHNVITRRMLHALEESLAGIESTPAARVVLLEAAGDRFFSAGADVREWGALSPQEMGRSWIREGNRVFQRLAQLDAVVICVIAGDALGGGLEMALAADVRLAADGVCLGFPEVGIGAIPGWLGCARLQELVGPGRARQMILTGEPVEASKAEGWGLVNEVIPRQDLRARTEELAGRIRGRSPVAVSVAKRVLNAGLDAERFGGLHELAATACLASSDAAEGLAAFREKRAPNFPPGALR
jgi:enoyl-CoA hydratase